MRAQLDDGLLANSLGDGPMSAGRSAIAAIAALAAVTVQAAAPQQIRVRGPQALLGDTITFTSPQFKVEALWFKANDETGWYWTGSDEVYAVFSDMDPTHGDRVTPTYENVDEGDLVNFRTTDTCMAPQPNCDRGMADLNVRFSFWESDYLWTNDFCPGQLAGTHDALLGGHCPGDDLIGQGSIIHSRDELVAMLPDVGMTAEKTVVMDQHAGKYRFRYRITRLPNVERSIVIHLPPDILTTISLQAVSAVVGGRPGVMLTWSGASTSTVDVYRDGAKIVTTPNDGSEHDPRGPGTYQYRLCELNSMTVCSPTVPATVQ